MKKTRGNLRCSEPGSCRPCMMKMQLDLKTMTENHFEGPRSGEQITWQSSTEAFFAPAGSEPPPWGPSWTSVFGPLQWPLHPGHDLGLKPPSFSWAAGTAIHRGPSPRSGSADLREATPPLRTPAFSSVTLSAAPAVSEEP